MDYEFKRDLSHSYLILTGVRTDQDRYQMKMLEKNKLQGMLPCTVRHVDEKIKYYYDISSKQPLVTAFSIQKMNSGQLTKLFLQLEAGFQELGQYLLDDRGLILDVRYMYWDIAEERLYMIYCPQVWETKAEDIHVLAEKLLNLIDYDDRKAIDAAYFFYQQTSIDNFTFTEVFSYFHRQVGMQEEMKPAEDLISENTALRGRALDEAVQSDAAETDGRYADQKALIYKHREPTKFDKFYKNEEDNMNNDKNVGENIQGLDWRRFFLVLAAGLVLLAVAAKYTLTYYELSEKEFLLGGGVLAVLPVAYLAYGMRKRKSARISTLQEEEEFSERKETDRRSEKTAKKEILIGAEKEAEKKAISPEPEENTEQEAVYGETVYFGAEQWQQERCLEGRIKGKQVSIAIHSFPFIIGKQPGAVSYVLPDVSVSRMHAQFTEKEGKLFLQDMNSKNGTYKNGVPMEASEAVEVFPGDEIRFGRLRFTYH